MVLAAAKAKVATVRMRAIRMMPERRCDFFIDFLFL
jgi:hypothetical protein